MIRLNCVETLLSWPFRMRVEGVGLGWGGHRTSPAVLPCITLLGTYREPLEISLPQCFKSPCVTWNCVEAMNLQDRVLQPVLLVLGVGGPVPGIAVTVLQYSSAVVLWGSVVLQRGVDVRTWTYCSCLHRDAHCRLRAGKFKQTNTKNIHLDLLCVLTSVCSLFFFFCSWLLASHFWSNGLTVQRSMFWCSSSSVDVWI